MRIAQVAPLQVAVPPCKYGGTERVIAELTEALVRQGHEVTLFASGDSQTSARLVPFIPQARGFDPAHDDVALHLALLTEVYQQAASFDVIHSHLEGLTLPFAAQTQTPPTVLTMHSRLDRPEMVRLMQAYADESAVQYVSISDDQRHPVAGVRWAATVYHGIDVDQFPFVADADPEGYLLFVGRLSPEKGPERAIEIATRAGTPLKIAAKIDPKNRAYFKQVIEPKLSHPLVEFLGPVDERRKRGLMAHARALVAPIHWPEPFGMVFIEAMACGTPVLTCPEGAAPEVVADGVTGYLRERDEDLVAAVGKLRALSRAACRRHAAERFSAARMADDYRQVYEQAVCHGPCAGGERA